MWDVLTNPLDRRARPDLLGPSVVAWGSHFFCKMPGDGKTVSWHQDASYWPLTPSKAVTVWLAIDDADRGQRVHEVHPGTHHLGHLTYKLTETDASNVLNQTVPDVEKYGEPVYVELKAGEASVHPRPALARLRREHHRPAPLRPDAPVHHDRRGGAPQLAREGRDRFRRTCPTLGQPRAPGEGRGGRRISAVELDGPTATL